MRINNLKKIASLSLVVGPLLTPYFLPGTTTTLDTVLMFLISIILFIHNPKFHLPDKFQYFFGYALLVPLIGSFAYGTNSGFVSSYVVILLIGLSFSQILPFLDFELVKRYYKIITYLACAFFIIQTISYYLLGWRPSALLPFLPVSYDYLSMGEFIQAQMYAPRSQSFFLEPSHFVQYILGYFCLILGDNIQKGIFYNKEMLAIIVILMITWSGTAILLLATLLLFYVIFFKTKLSTKIAVIFPICILLTIGIFQMISTTDQGNALLNRAAELSIDADRVSSGTMRIYRGHFVYSSMPTILKIFGVGPGYCGNAVDNSSYLWMFKDFERYLNTSQTLLIGYGIIGTILFLVFIFNLRSKGNSSGLFLIIYFIGLSLMESFFGTSKMLLILGVAYSAKLYYKHINNEKSNASLRHKTRSDQNGSAC